MTSRMWHKIGKIVHRCEDEQDAGLRFMNDFKRIQLVEGIKQREEHRLCRQLIYYEDTKPGFLKEIIHERHLERVHKNELKREVREDHKHGIADPGRLAANLEKRMFFREHIKIDNKGKKMHKVNQ